MCIRDRFLIPPSLTIVYGLGLGTIVVLVLAPALFAVQHDITFSLRSATVVISRLLSKRRPRFASTAQPVAADPPLADEGA